MNTSIAVQYLESLPRHATLKDTRVRLHNAFLRLPISKVLLGWNLPDEYEDAVAEETNKFGAELYRWQPMLTGDSQVNLPEEWGCIGLLGDRIKGMGGISEFSFVCPNQPAVIDFMYERIDRILNKGIFKGIFLDRIRFPSPMNNLEENLGCFCPYCLRIAADSGLDLKSTQEDIKRSLKSRENLISIITESFPYKKSFNNNGLGQAYKSFLEFRQKSISKYVRTASKYIKQKNLDIGLDCFSPKLTRLVGQNLSELNSMCDWLKIMVYPRVYGPAGISYELTGFNDWLRNTNLFSKSQRMKIISKSSGYFISPLNNGCQKLIPSSKIIEQEILLGKEMGINQLYAGIALVIIKNIHDASLKQIHTDMQACARAKPEGIVLSWDLWNIPDSILEIANSLWA